MAGDVAVSVHGLGKSFGRTVAVRDVSFHARRGAVLGVLGPNGAGKTTTVRMLATLTVPDWGRATIDGFDVVRDATDVRRVISLTGQYASVDQHLTGRENLRLVLRLHHIAPAAARRRADELLGQFELEHAADRTVRTYSGGMRRRLDLAASVANRPSVLFLDEPTTGLDPASRVRMWGAVRDLVGEGTTVILTTQYLEEADQLCDDLVVVDHGTVVARGTPDELKSAVGGDAIEIVVARTQTVRRAVSVVERSTKASASVDEVTGRIVVPVGDDAAPLLAVLVRGLADAGVALSGIGLRRPSLDEVFMAITGHHAGDGTEDGSGDAATGDVAGGRNVGVLGVRRGGVAGGDGGRSSGAAGGAGGRSSGAAGGAGGRNGSLSVQARTMAVANSRGLAAAGPGPLVAMALADAGLAAGVAGAGRGRPGGVRSATDAAHRLATDWTMVAWRNTVRFVRQPLAVVSMVLQPVMFVAMFRYVFGGALALAVPGGHFVSFLLPGIVAQTMAFAAMSTAIGLAEDIGSGMVDRLRSLPVVRSAVLVGRLLTDFLQSVVVVGVIVGVGVAVGFRFVNGPGPALGMVAVALGFGLVSSSATAYLGIRTRSPELAMTIGLTLLFPVCFVSGAFVPIATLPGWLQPVARANPVTVVVEAMRALALGGPVGLRTVEAVGWMAAIAAFFVPLAIRAYRNSV
ncbi:MAG: ATP-binding cassette domain-containing protein [Actinomycetota bacterium]|nr:ATP-binding cassette domain-containing protein [Actinomycetota bacterium]